MTEAQLYAVLRIFLRTFRVMSTLLWARFANKAIPALESISEMDISEILFS